MQAEKRHRQHSDPKHRKALSHAAPPQSASRPAVLCIGGSDSSGLAGLQMDARFCQAMNVHQSCVVTAITAQNTQSVLSSTPTSKQDCQAQFDAAMALKPQAIKIGLIASLEQLQWLCEVLAGVAEIPVIYDPVTVASSGGTLASQTVADNIVSLLPHCDLITPNLPEAACLSGVRINNNDDIQASAQWFHRHGVDWVYVKGGHSESNTVRDTVSHEHHTFGLAQARQNTQHLRGTGCALATSVASAVALGFDMVDALVIANMAVAEGIRHAQAVNEETGPISAVGFPKHHWPHYIELSGSAPPKTQPPFLACIGPHAGIERAASETEALGLYPVVDSYHWLERLLPLGIHTIQLRIKGLPENKLKQEIEKSIALARQYACRLFINDHWKLAIELGAYGIHLGQEDLDNADLNAISQAGIRLGISNHNHFELVRCLAIDPSYIACGPVFSTQSKEMPWVPHGLEGLQYWCDSLAHSQDRPVVAIGGINHDNISDVARCTCSGIALISAITAADKPEAAAQELLQLIAKVKTEPA